jgi:amino acid adenylation domain-containing protein
MEQLSLIHARFESRARTQPEALAVASAHGELSYGKLYALSSALAARIARIGSAGDVVAILAERGPQLVVAILACARAGRPFAVLDSAYPASRLVTLAGICRPRLLLLAGCEPPADLIALDLPSLAVTLEAPPASDAHSPPVAISPDAPAYLLFTSGSTGTPKCVAVSHRPLTHFVAWQETTFGLGADDRFTLLSGLSHDPVLRDLFTPLSLGASIHIPAQATLTAPGGLLDWFVTTRPTIAHMTPPLGRLLTAAPATGGRLDGLRHVFWGGDILRQPLIDALTALAPKAESVNFYGSTETPQAAAFFRVRAGAVSDRTPIGAGVDGFTLEIRQEDGRPTEDGETGEIVVRSRFLTLGYVEDGRLPAPRTDQGEGCYATGDVGHRRADGQIVIEGRRDDQVKVRGYRVELAEITACALSAPGVAQAVTLNLGSADEVRLGCFVEADPAAERALRDHISARLPAYMVPDAIIALPALPLLPNGKIDRQSLLAQERERNAQRSRPVASMTPVQAALAAHWREIFRRDDIGADGSFASLGGDSLSYVTAYLSIEEVVGRVPEGWTTMSLAELAGAADSGARRSAFAEVESAILLRALAISAVVASHFQLISTGSAATSALIWVSGCLFGGLQLRQAEHQSSLSPIVRLLKSLFLPLLLIEAPQVMIKFAAHYHARFSSVFLYTDLIDYRGMATSGPEAYGGHEYLMWYVHCLIHIVLIMAALIFVFGRLPKVKRPVLAALGAAIALGLIGRFVLTALLVPSAFSRGVDPLSVFNHSPTAHLATFALAALAGFLGGRRRIEMMSAALVFSALGAPLYGLADSIAIATVAGLLLFVPKLSLPRVLSRPVYMIAGASFFIYLLHFKFLALFDHLLHLPALLAWPGAILGGVAAWSAWTWTTQRIDRLWAALGKRPWGGLRGFAKPAPEAPFGSVATRESQVQAI